mgnify:CR=1 FL=1
MMSIKYIDVFPFSRTDDGLRFLLLRRAVDNTYPGIWQPIAGKIKAGEKAWEAGLRELKEETGFTPVNYYALDHVSTYYLHRTDEIVQVPAFLAEVTLEDPAISKEHDIYKWLSLGKAKKTASWEPYRKALDVIPKLLASSPTLALAKILLKKPKNHLNP